ncbi:MAG: hypothetical protein IPG59_00940 [Candidatus Melainabacteria bacterium]|nr:MAG: hypothetical protein IPG59_00940 [Candidatus Melainabacteria bacterium]
MNLGGLRVNSSNWTQLSLSGVVDVDADQLLLLALISRPQVLFFGEVHRVESRFRNFFFGLLPTLQELGFRNLAIELLEADRAGINRYFNDMDLAALQRAFASVRIREEGLDVIDAQFMNAIRDWQLAGGNILLVNSLEPTNNPLTNNRGRDWRMFEQIRDAGENTIAFLGLFHTMLRNDRTMRTIEEARAFLLAQNIDQDPVEWVQENHFMSAAERIRDFGLTTVTVGEFPGIQGWRNLRTRVQIGAGQASLNPLPVFGRQIALELVEHRMRIFPTDWHAVLFEDPRLLDFNRLNELQ